MQWWNTYNPITVSQGFVQTEASENKDDVSHDIFDTHILSFSAVKALAHGLSANVACKKLDLKVGHWKM